MEEAEQERVRRRKIVVEECDGIVPHYEVFYLVSVMYAAGRADEAFNRYKAALDHEDDDLDDALVVASVHEALTHVAALSRFFWPASKKSLPQARGQRLRQAFDIEDDCPLHDRELRNALEHFDERLDEYLIGNLAGNIFPGPMVDTAALAQDSITKIFRLVDPEWNLFVLLGEQHSFGGVHEMVVDIFNKALEMCDNGGNLRLRIATEHR
jgi:hypothetical protein